MLDLENEVRGPSPNLRRPWDLVVTFRYALNFKKLPFTTIFLDFVDVEGVCERIGAEPTIRYKPPGSEEENVIFTVPVIYDPKTGRVVSESLAIAEYLDDAYPAPGYPALFKPGTKGLTRAFGAAIDRIPTVLPTAYPFLLPATFPIVKDTSREYFRRTREAAFNRISGEMKTLEEVYPQGNEKVEAWAKVRGALATIASWYSAEGGKWITGNEPCYADLIVAAYLIWFRKVFKEGSEEWRDVKEWDNGRWAELLDACSIYETP